MKMGVQLARRARTAMVLSFDQVISNVWVSELVKVGAMVSLPAYYALPRRTYLLTKSRFQVRASYSDLGIVVARSDLRLDYGLEGLC
jgi:hypothetical protein